MTNLQQFKLKSSVKKRTPKIKLCFLVHNSNNRGYRLAHGVRRWGKLICFLYLPQQIKLGAFDFLASLPILKGLVPGSLNGWAGGTRKRGTIKIEPPSENRARR